MIYSVHIYTVDADRLPTFLAAFRRGGLWTDIARLQAGHIHTDVLMNPFDGSKFMSIQFWASIQSLLKARRSRDVRSFGRWVDHQAIEHVDVGTFLFPPQPDSEDLSLADLTCEAASLISEPPFDSGKEVH